MIDWVSRIMDALFPRAFRCVVCGAEIPDTLAVPICEDCFPVRNDGRVCAHCGRPLGNEARFCDRCIEFPGRLTMMRSALVYTGSAVTLIRGLKFGRKRYLGEALAPLMRELCGEVRECGIDAVIPVPLSRLRARERGYNQAELLARPVAEELGVPLAAELLSKVRDIPHQARLGARERFANIRGCFVAADTPVWRGKTLLLVDDVMTTGATLEECAAALARLRPAAIYALTLASGRRRTVF